MLPEGLCLHAPHGGEPGLIAEIEGGIKKEVSVSCAVQQTGVLHLRP